MYSELPTSETEVQENQNREGKRFGMVERPGHHWDENTGAGVNSCSRLNCRLSFIFEVLPNACGMQLILRENDERFQDRPDGLQSPVRDMPGKPTGHPFQGKSNVG